MLGLLHLRYLPTLTVNWATDTVYINSSRRFTIVKDQISVRRSFQLRVQKGHGTQLLVQHIACEGRLSSPIRWIFWQLGRASTNLNNIRSVETINAINTEYAFLFWHDAIVGYPEKSVMYPRTISTCNHINGCNSFSYPWWSKTRSIVLMRWLIFSYLQRGCPQVSKATES